MKLRVVSAILVMMVLGAGNASAGSGAGAIIYSFNTSARYEGMGGAGGGSPWGDATNHWANPAQLAYRRGVQWEWYKSELAQGLSRSQAVAKMLARAALPSGLRSCPPGQDAPLSDRG